MLLAVFYPRFGLLARRRILQRWSAGLLDILNVSLNIRSEDYLSASPSGLIVANHISWLDVIVLNAVIPMRFVAKSELRDWPAIGWLAARVQTLFIARGKARAAAQMNSCLVDLLQAGESLAIFPEGTSTDGREVGRFHASLLQSAIDAQVQVHPVAICYQDEQGAHSTVASFIDEMSFATSLWNVLCTPNLHVALIATPSLEAKANERRALTHAAHTQISLAVAAMHLSGSLDNSTSEHPEVDHFQSMFGLLLLSKSSNQ
jgi:1-acyl-sn-glycerol-3-phosphate acyltransferase